MTSGNNSVVECNLAKVEVASSNLVSRSISHKPKLAAPAGIIAIVLRPRNSVVEYLLGKEEVIGSIPIVGSNVCTFIFPFLLLPIPRPRRAVFFFRPKKIRDRRATTRYRASGLYLVTAAVVLWKTVRLERAAIALHDHGKEVEKTTAVISVTMGLGAYQADG